MLVRTKEELEEVKKLIPKEFLANPEFESLWDWNVKSSFEEKKPINITVSDEKKTISVIPKVEVNRNSPLPTGTLNAYEFHISARGEMEVTNSHGEMYDASAYYMGTGKKPTTTTSVLRLHYRKTVYDNDGIERAVGMVMMGDCPLDVVIILNMI